MSPATQTLDGLFAIGGPGWHCDPRTEHGTSNFVRILCAQPSSNLRNLGFGLFGFAELLDQIKDFGADLGQSGGWQEAVKVEFLLCSSLEIDR
jgi:hypothetical protein